MTDTTEVRLGANRKVNWDFTFAFLALRLWLGVRALFVGIQKFAAYKSVAMPLIDPSTGQPDASGVMVNVNVKSYALANYAGIPAALSDKFAQEPLFPKFALVAFRQDAWPGIHSHRNHALDRSGHPLVAAGAGSAFYRADSRSGSDRSERRRGLAGHSHRPCRRCFPARRTQPICGPQKMVDPFLNRRDFIGATAVAGAGMLLKACKSDSAPKAGVAGKSSLSTINIALIGYGEEGKVLLESLLNIEGVRLVALCDIWDYHLKEGARYLEKIGNEVRTYENYEDLLAKEKDLQAVVVATPDFCHAPMTNTCLKAGLHVYCEKMMSNTIDGRALHGQDHARNRKAVADRPSAAQQPPLPIHPEPPAARGAILRPADRRAGAMEPRGEGRLRLAQEIRDARKHARQVRLQRHAPVPQLALVQGTRRRTAVRPRRASDRHFQLVAGHAEVRDRQRRPGLLQEPRLVRQRDGHLRVSVGPGRGARVYQVQTTTSAGGGYFEMFMGDDGTIKMSEDPSLCAIYREARATEVSGTTLVQKGYVRAKANPADDAAKVDVRETAQLAEYEIPVFFNKPPHQPHLENFFNAIRGTAKLNCPGDEAFSSEYTIHKANEAVAAQTRVAITTEEVRA
jgi:predicted dehydrogenase